MPQQIWKAVIPNNAVTLGAGVQALPGDHVGFLIKTEGTLALTFRDGSEVTITVPVGILPISAVSVDMASSSATGFALFMV